ncbi:MAG TPA: YXWGXW repeat-containing protein [Rhodanobacteraceae bacterium]|nr:YXWGXW repeat-containing protein [Rhodanobacteraceae bacterium]
MKRIATTLLVAGLMASPMLALPPPAAAGVSIGVSIGIAPPALPVYEQPMAPAAGYIWTPGYWAWSGNGYYWVPGTWVMPPVFGLLWTPGWWGWSDGSYRWHGGYWGRHVGFYGGVNYGFGYFGTGYSGGYWRGRDFYYNRAVNNINVTNIHNVYVDRTVIRNVNRVSYNGGRGGIAMQPSAAQREYANQRRYQPTSMQTRQRDAAMRNPAQRFESNHGRPAVFATQHAGRFDGPHAVRTSGQPQPRTMVAPERAHGMVTAPRARTQSTSNREHGFVEAPHNRGQSMRPEQRVHGNPENAPSRNNAYRGNGMGAPQPASRSSKVTNRPTEHAQRAAGKHEQRREGSQKDHEHGHQH